MVYGDRPEAHVAKALRRVLREVLGSPTGSIWDTIRLAIRNTVRPSRILRMAYSIPSVAEPGDTLDVVI